MRWFLIILTLLTPACGLVGEDHDPPALVTLTGTISEAEVTLEAASELWVALSWHVYIPGGLNDRYAVAEEVEADASGDYELVLRSPPPARAQIPLEALEVDGPEDAWVALGFLTVFDPVESGISFDWGDVGFFDFPISWGGADEYLVVYVSSSEGIEGGLLDIDADLEPGIQVLGSADEGAFLAHQSTDVEIPLQSLGERWAGDWEPSHEICRWKWEGEKLDIWDDHEDYPDEFPDPSEVSCGECGVTYDAEQCDIDLGVLCSNCVVVRVWAQTPMPPDWPCFPEGKPCNPLTDSYACAFDFQYECGEDGWWELSEDCTEGRDCCNSGCSSIEEEEE